MHIGKTAIYDKDEGGAAFRTRSAAIAKLIGENERQSGVTGYYAVPKGSRGFRFKNRADSPYRQFDQQWLEALWSAQVIASWLTDWQIWDKTFPDQVGLVQSNDFSPSNISPLELVNSGAVLDGKPIKHTTLDLRPILTPIYIRAGKGIIQGPDGIYGGSSDSLFANYANTGKIFGRDVPAEAKPLFDGILRSISTTAIEKGLRDRDAGNVSAQQSAAAMTADSVTGDAQVNAGMVQTKPSYLAGQSWGSIIKPNQFVKTLDPAMFAKITKFQNFPTQAFLNLTPAATGTKTSAQKRPPAGLKFDDIPREEIEKSPDKTKAAQEAPFYKRPWFYIGAPLVLFTAGAGIYVYQSKKKRGAL